MVICPPPFHLYLLDRVHRPAQPKGATIPTDNPKGNVASQNANKQLPYSKKAKNFKAPVKKCPQENSYFSSQLCQHDYFLRVSSTNVRQVCFVETHWAIHSTCILLGQGQRNAVTGQGTFSGTPQNKTPSTQDPN